MNKKIIIKIIVGIIVLISIVSMIFIINKRMNITSEYIEKSVSSEIAVLNELGFERKETFFKNSKTGYIIFERNNENKGTVEIKYNNSQKVDKMKIFIEYDQDNFNSAIYSDIHYVLYCFGIKLNEEYVDMLKVLLEDKDERKGDIVIDGKSFDFSLKKVEVNGIKKIQFKLG